MINTYMKLHELLNEDCTDLVAGYYVEASKELDRQYNPEATHFANENKEYYEKYFKDWFNEGEIPIFEKPVIPAQPSYRHNPQPGQSQSAGYRGKQNALRAAGLPYNKDVKSFNPRIQPTSDLM